MNLVRMGITKAWIQDKAGELFPASKSRRTFVIKTTNASGIGLPFSTAFSVLSNRSRAHAENSGRRGRWVSALYNKSRSQPGARKGTLRGYFRFGTTYNTIGFALHRSKQPTLVNHGGTTYRLCQVGGLQGLNLRDIRNVVLQNKFTVTFSSGSFGRCGASRRIQVTLA